MSNFIKILENLDTDFLKVKDDNGIAYKIPKNLENLFSEYQDKLIDNINPKHKGYLKVYGEFLRKFRKYQTIPIN